LRKSLAAACGDVPVGHYLLLEKKQLRLINCRVDALEFGHYARKGLHHVRRREYWRAECAFRIAHSHWQGKFITDVPGFDRYRDDLNNLYVSSTTAWIDTLCIAGAEEEALEVAQAAVNHLPTDTSLVSRLYDLHTQLGEAVEAHKVLTNYEKALREVGYSPDEVDELMDGFWDPAETAS